MCLYSFEVGGVRFAHLGDIGRTLTAQQIQALGNVVLFVPVGGVFTIGPAEAIELIRQLPTLRIVIPMHYFVEGCCPWKDIAPLGDFLTLVQGTWPIREIGGSRVTVAADDLPESVEVWVMQFATE